MVLNKNGISVDEPMGSLVVASVAAATVAVIALLGLGSNEGARGTSPEGGVWGTLWYRRTDSCDVVAHHQASICLIRAIKRVRRRRIRLREKR
jgi:hypothetical protein